MSSEPSNRPSDLRFWLATTACPNAHSMRTSKTQCATKPSGLVMPPEIDDSAPFNRPRQNMHASTIATICINQTDFGLRGTSAMSATSERGGAKGLDMDNLGKWRQGKAYRRRGGVRRRHKTKRTPEGVRS